MKQRLGQKGATCSNSAQADAVRNNTALMLRGVVSRADMLKYGIAGLKTLALASRHEEAFGMTPIIKEYKRGRAGVDADMLKKIQEHVMDPQWAATDTQPKKNKKKSHHFG